MPTAYPGLVSPIPLGTSFLRIDQGVDYDAPSPCLAVGDGVIVHVSPPGSWAGGTGEAVYLRLDNAVTVNGHTYDEIYYAERTPLVSEGMRVGPGSPVMAAGSNELGFARNSQPACPLVGGLGAGTQPTICGNDFRDFVALLQGQPPPVGARAGTGGTVYVPFPKLPKIGPLAPVPQDVTKSWTALMKVFGETVPTQARYARVLRSRFGPAVMRGIRLGTRGR